MMFWVADWAWSLPLILLTVVIHVFGLTIINESVVRIMSGTTHRRSVIPIFVIVMCIAVLLMTALHTIEASAWAGAYRLLGGCLTTRQRFSTRSAQ